MVVTCDGWKDVQVISQRNDHVSKAWFSSTGELGRAEEGVWGQAVAAWSNLCLYNILWINLLQTFEITTNSSLY